MTLGITLLASLLMVGVVVALGDVVAAVFGSGYDRTAELLPALAVAWIPWAMAQGLLIRLTAASSRSGVVVIIGLAFVQWFGGHAVLPSVEGFVVYNGAIGVVTLIALLVVHATLMRRADPGPEAGSGYARTPSVPEPDAGDDAVQEDGTR